MKRSVGLTANHELDTKFLRKDREIAVKFARLAVDGLNDAAQRGDSLLVIRALAKAFRGLDAIASEVGITRATLRRALSPRGNPRMKVIEATLKPLGLSLSVVPQPKKARTRAAKKPAKASRVRVAA